MKSFLTSSWCTATVGVLAYLATTWFTLSPAKLLRQAAARSATIIVSSGPTPSWNFYSTELDQLLAEVREERDALKVKAQQLNDLKTRLEAERQEICTITQRVWQLQKDFEQGVVRIKEGEQTNLKKMVKMYAAMGPESASRIIKELEDEQALKILASMKEADSAAIFDNISKGGGADAKRAALLMNRLRLAVPGATELKTASK